jgi:16S rRNA (cytosine967-C5)-methyltransferase
MTQDRAFSAHTLSTAEKLALAGRVVAGVRVRGVSLDDSLDACTGAMTDAADAAAIQALAYGSVRWYHRLDYWLSRLLAPGAKQKPELHALLVVALHQLAFSNHPPHAIVDQAVEACRKLGQPRATGLVNAVLRRFLREQRQLIASAEQTLPARYAHPAWLIELVRRDWPEHWSRILDAGNQQAPMWLRVNRRQTTREAYVQLLNGASIGANTSNYAADAVRLESPRPVSALPGFEAGSVSVQDAGAQLAAELIGVGASMRVLDACAAPGGKSCHLLEHTELDLVAIDASVERLKQLSENLRRLKLSATLIAADAADTSSWWDGRPFERILLDAPCTASGVIRRHPDIKLLKRPADVEALQLQQLRLLRALWPLLAEGGRLLYATCSVLRAENEQVVTKFLDGEPGATSVPIPQSFDPPGVRMARDAGMQILPGEAGMDGFYYACMEKRRTGALAVSLSA